MRRKSIVLVAAMAVLILGEAPVTNIAQAGIFDMMSPSRWFGNNDRDRDYYGGRGYGYGPGYYGGWGGPYGGYPGGGWGGPYGGYPGGWGGPYGGYPGYYGYPYGVAPATQSSEKPAPRLPE